MSKVRRIFSNMGWLVSSQLIITVCTFIWTIIIARYLGVFEYGIYGFAVSITGIMVIIADFGINTHIVRDVSTDYSIASKYLGNAIPLKSVFAIASVLLLLLVLFLLGTDELTVKVTMLFAIEMVLKSFFNLLKGAFQAFEDVKYQAIGNNILHVVLLAFIIIAIYTDMGIFAIAVSYITATAIALAYGFYALNKNIVRPKYEFDREFCKKITVLSIPFAITGILFSAYYFLDIIMLENIIGSYAAGIYNAAYKLIPVQNILVSIYIAIIFPVMSKLFKNNDDSMLIFVYEKSVKYMLMLIIPFSVLIVIYAPALIQIIYGSEYAAASTVLATLIWTVSLLFVLGPGTNLLNSSHKEMAVNKIYIFGAVINVILNLIFIPQFSYYGAVFSTILSYALIAAIQRIVIYRLGHGFNRKLYIDLLRIIVGSLILGVIFNFLTPNIWIALPIAIIIYFPLIYLLGAFDKDDKYIIKEILGKK
ncbi:MAG: flippase [Methanobrevibacter sp.]|nr:flippase [Methanobrevibacter sp.]